MSRSGRWYWQLRPDVARSYEVRYPKPATRRRRCPYCGRPSTYVVKWPAGEVTQGDAFTWAEIPEPRTGRNFYCAEHAREVLAYQCSVGSGARAYRYRYMRGLSGGFE